MKDTGRAKLVLLEDSGHEALRCACMNNDNLRWPATEMATCLHRAQWSARAYSSIMALADDCPLCEVTDVKNAQDDESSMS
jgi:hypothetical protein